ncbi:hypothetical protein KAR28_05660 [Candidatus Parcubacteria bacterium]|nr:hypothetical protein [Candidatus Parcubacteria bacterium]
MLSEKEKPIWLWEFNRQMDLLRIFSFAKSYLKYKIKFFYINNHGNTNYYWDKITAEKIAKKILQKSLKSNYLNDEFKNIKKTIDKYNYIINKFRKLNFTQLSNKTILKNYLLYYETLYKGGIGAVFIRIFIFGAEPFLRSQLEKKYKNKANTVLSLLTSSDKLSFTQKEEIELLKIVFQIIFNKYKINSKFVDKSIKKHLERYAYIPCGYFDEKPYSYIDIKNRIEKILILSSEQIKEKINLYHKYSLKQKTKYLNQNKQIKKIIKGVEFAIFYKEAIRGKMNELTYHSTPLFKEISKRINLNLKEFKMLTPDEFKEVLLNNKNYKNIITKRRKFLVYGDSRQIIIYDSSRAGRLLDLFSKNIMSFSSDIIKGNCANYGKTKGNVRIIKKYTDTIKINEILVTTMTTPEYVPLMKKASAFITDEGGITCHAAIIAREMNKPCIIGTKIATKVLRDGQLVEVDANKGTVRIIK